MRFFNVLAKSIAYYGTNNPNHVLFLFFFSKFFYKVCFHTILNKSKNIDFHVNFPSCLVFAFDWLQFLAISPRYQAAVFPLAHASSFVLDNSFRKHSAIIFHYIIFQIWSWLFVKLLFLFINRGTSSCDHPVNTTTSCPTPIVFLPRCENLRVTVEDLFNATTSLHWLRPGFYGPTLVASTWFHCIF